MKRRLDEPTLPEVCLPFAGQQPLAEQPLRALEPPPFLEAARVGDEDVTHVGRMVDEVQVLAPDVQVREVTVAAGKAREERERITSGEVDDGRQRRPLGTGRVDSYSVTTCPRTDHPPRDEAVDDVRIAAREVLGNGRRRLEDQQAAVGRIAERPGHHDLAAGVRFPDQPKVLLAIGRAAVDEIVDGVVLENAIVHGSANFFTLRRGLTPGATSQMLAS